MNNLVTVTNGKVVVSSRQVAETFGKRHADVLRSLQSLECSKEFTERNFALSGYRDSSGKSNPEYLMTRDGFTFLTMGFTDRETSHWKERYIQAFNEMEQQLTKPMSQLDILAQSVQILQQQAKEIMEVKEDVKVLNSRINTMDKIDLDGTERQQLVGMVNRYAYDKGISIGMAWREFKRKFDIAYSTNLSLLIHHYKEKHGLNKKPSTPHYLVKSGRIQDGIRIIDSMLNR